MLSRSGCRDAYLRLYGTMDAKKKTQKKETQICVSTMFVDIGLKPFFLDSGFLSCQAAQVIDTCPANPAVFVDLNFINER